MVINKQNTTKSERKGQENRSATKKAPARQPQQLGCGTSIIIGRFSLRCRSGTLLPCLPSPFLLSTTNRGFPTTATPPLPTPLNATHNGSAALPTQFRLIVRNTSGRERSKEKIIICLLYTSPSPRDRQKSRMPSSA